METLTTLISILLLLGMIGVPILLFVGLNKWNGPRFHFLKYLFIGVILSAGITGAFAWWSDYSDQLLMAQYGYDFDAMNDTDRFEKVEPQNLERVKQLETGYYGIGWPLQAMMTFVFYLPYLLVVYLFGHFTMKRNRSKKQQIPVGAHY